MWHRCCSNNRPLLCKAQWGGPQSHSPPRGINRSQPQGRFTYLWHMQVLHQPPAGRPSTTCRQGVGPLVAASTRRATRATALRAGVTMRTTVNASRPHPRPPWLAPMCKVTHQLNERSESVCNKPCTRKGSSSLAAWMRRDSFNSTNPRNAAASFAAHHRKSNPASAATSA